MPGPKSLNDTSNPFAGPDLGGKSSGPARAHAVRMLLAAAALSIALHFVPYAGYLTYPLRLLGTFIHEGSHALMTLLTGGLVRSISIQPDGSGLTESLGGIQLLISPAGYLGATLYGALLIALLRRGVSGKALLLVTGALIGLVTVGVFGGLLFTRNFFGLFWGVMLTLGLLIGGVKLSPLAANWTAAFVGVQCVLNALYDLAVLFQITTMGGAQNDAMNMQKMTFIPAPVWATFWIATALGMLYLTLRPAKRARSPFAV